MGSFSYFVGLIVFGFSTGIFAIQLESIALTAPATIISAVIVLFALSTFYAWLLSMIPTKTGPIRMYLSGLALPAFVMTITMLPLRIGNLLGGS